MWRRSVHWQRSRTHSTSNRLISFNLTRLSSSKAFQSFESRSVASKFEAQLRLAAILRASRTRSVTNTWNLSFSRFHPVLTSMRFSNTRAGFIFILRSRAREIDSRAGWRRLLSFHARVLYEGRSVDGEVLALVLIYHDE